MLGFRITHSLSERDKLRLIELHRSGEPLIIDRPAEYGCQPFRSAKQIDVLTDEASIDRGVKPLLFVGDILHEIAMSGIDEIERIGRDKFLGNVVKALPRDLVLLTAIASWFLRSALLQHQAPYEESKDLRQPLVMTARVAWR